MVPAPRAGHLTGPIWSNGTLSHYGNTVTSFVTTGGLEQIRGQSLRFGGYQGPLLPGLGYLGVGVVVVSVGGLLVWRHDRRLLLFGGVGVVAAVLSLGPGHGHWVPWQVVERVPWVGDVVEIRLTGDHPVRGGDGVGGHRPGPHLGL